MNYTRKYDLRIYTDGSAWYGYRPSFAFCIVKGDVLFEAHAGICHNSKTSEGVTNSHATLAEAMAVASALLWLRLNKVDGEVVTDNKLVAACCRFLLRTKDFLASVKMAQEAFPEFKGGLIRGVMKLISPHLLCDLPISISIWWEGRGNSEWNILADEIAHKTRMLHGKDDRQTGNPAYNKWSSMAKDCMRRDYVL